MLTQEDELAVDFESSGLRWWGGDYPCGLAVGTRDGRRWYLPTRHEGGGNIPEDKVVDWMRSPDGLAGKHLVTFQGAHDVHMSRVMGAYFEDLGCSITDVAHYAALLDDSRRELNLESVAQTYLGVGKVKGLDVSRGAHIYHPSEVEAYAERDVELTMDLRIKLLPMIQEQELDEVLGLEEDCIFPTAEMEFNGAPLDIELLETWMREVQADFVKSCWDLFHEVGFKVEPTKLDDVSKVFHKYGIPIPTVTAPGPDQGKESFEDQYLRKIPHPAVQLLRRSRKLANLSSKFFVPYHSEYQRNGMLRYALKQLRSDEGGTISGRYSSCAFSRTHPKEGINVQQVAGKKQLAALKDADPVLAKYRIRRLFRPASGLWGSADAEQIEYRLFAHYARPPRVIAAYEADPRVDFHNIVMEMIRLILPSITRERTKDLNFAMLYGAGLRKIAYMLGVTEGEAKRFVDAYMSAFPEAKRLLAFAMRVAEKRGYVKTLLGRRARFSQGYGLHAALNRIIQGTAADINKRKIVEVYRERKRLGITMRFTVHDELCGDVPDVQAMRELQRLLNVQSFDTCVPILWSAKCGPNWADAEAA